MRDTLDLDRYPLDRAGSAQWHALVDRCRANLAGCGMFSLDAFMPPAVAQGTADALAPKFASESFLHARAHNIYFANSVEGLHPDHPALTQFHTSNNTLCADQVQDTPLHRLYHWSAFADFLAACLQLPTLHPMADPLAGLNVMSYAQGQTLNWHFDRSEFTTTLLLHAPRQGGVFQYRTDLRSQAEPNHDGVAKLLRNEDPALRELALDPGTLNVFRGRNTPHRVTPVEGDRARMIAVFSFFDRPGVRFTESEQLGFYGRAAP